MTNWKYWVMRKLKPLRVKKPTVTDPLAAVNRGFLNSPTSSIGRAIRRSTLTKIARMPRPRAIVPSVRAELHPQPGAWMMLRTSVPSPALERKRPRQSMGGAVGSLDEGTAQATSPATTAATGTMKRKTLPHQKWPSSHPPTIGPVATPTPAVAPHSPMACARSLRSVKTFASNDRVDGKIPAAPMPIRARAAISSWGVLQKEPARLPAANTPNPASRTPLRPMRSLRLPAARMSAANTRL